MIEKHIGKILLAGNMILGVLLVTTLFTKTITTDRLMLVIIQTMLALNALALLYYVIGTYLYFKEKDILFGTVGFALIALAYTTTAVLALTNSLTLQLEASINMIITIGYLSVTIAVGWMRG